MATFTINGRTFTGGSISVVGNRILIDGADQLGAQGVVEVRVLEGRVEHLTSDSPVSVLGARVEGNVTAGGSVDCDDVGGSVSAGGSVNCGNVRGSVTAGGSIHRG